MLKNFDLKPFFESLSITQKDTLCVGVSGWVDSMVLLYAITRCHPKEKIIVLHINHLLRGEESNLDEALVEKMAEIYGVRFLSLRENIAKIAKKECKSIETVGREIRRSFFLENLEKFQAKRIFLAHHQGDQAETVLRNFIKGSRLRWLSGMMTDDEVFARPFLQISKREIREFAEQNSIAWREDSSNTSSDYERNFLRNEILPLVKEINPTVEESLAEFATFSREVSLYFDQILEEVLSQNSIHTKDFAHMTTFLQDMLIERIYRACNDNSTIGLSSGNIKEIRRYILEARWGTEKIISSLSLTKKENIVSWNKNTL